MGEKDERTQPPESEERAQERDPDPARQQPEGGAPEDEDAESGERAHWSRTPGQG